MKSIILALAVTAVFPNLSLASIHDFRHDPQNNACGKLTSCASCVSKSYCVWRITKNKCSSQFYGNGNAIYPQHIKALMPGPGFCPRIVRPDTETILRNGQEHNFVVKLTQIYAHMAFTVWKCKINVNGEDSIVNAVLIADEVYCGSVVLSNKSDKPVEGSTTVLWDNNKSLDGSLLFTVSL